MPVSANPSASNDCLRTCGLVGSTAAPALRKIPDSPSCANSSAGFILPVIRLPKAPPIVPPIKDAPAKGIRV